MRIACASCKTDSNGKGLLLCTGCELVSYCSSTCQRRHWPEHNRECVGKMKEAKDPAIMDVGVKETEGERSSTVLPVAEMAECLEGGAQLLARGEVESAIENLTLGVAHYKRACIGSNSEVEAQLEEDGAAVLVVANLLDVRSTAFRKVSDMEKAAEDCLAAHKVLVGGPKRRERMQAEAALVYMAVKMLVRAAHTVGRALTRRLACSIVADELLGEWIAKAGGEVTEETAEYATGLKRMRASTLRMIGRTAWEELVAELGKSEFSDIAYSDSTLPVQIPYACSFPRHLAPTPSLLPIGMRKHLYEGTTIEYLVKGATDPLLFLDTIVMLIGGEVIQPGNPVGTRCPAFRGLVSVATRVPGRRPKDAGLLWQGRIEWHPSGMGPSWMAATALLRAIQENAEESQVDHRVSMIFGILFLMFSDVVPISAAMMVDVESSEDWEPAVPCGSDPVWKFARLISSENSPLGKSMTPENVAEISAWRGVANPLVLEHKRIDMWNCLRDVTGRGCCLEEEDLMEYMREQFWRVVGWFRALPVTPAEASLACKAKPTFFMYVLQESEAFAPPKDFLRDVIGRRLPEGSACVVVLPARFTGLSLRLEDRHAGDTLDSIAELTGLSAAEWERHLGLRVTATEAHQQGAAMLVYEWVQKCDSAVKVPAEVMLRAWMRLVAREDETVVVQGVAVRKAQSHGTIRALMSVVDDFAELQQGLAALMDQLKGRRGSIARSRMGALLLRWTTLTRRDKRKAVQLTGVLKIGNVSSLPLLRPLESSLRACVLRQPYRPGLFKVGCGLTDVSRINSMPVTMLLESLPEGSVAEAIIASVAFKYVAGQALPMLAVTRLSVAMRRADLSLGRCGSLVVFSRYSENVIAYGGLESFR